MKTAKRYLTIGPRVKGASAPLWHVSVTTEDPPTTQADMKASVRSYAEAERRAEEAGLELRISQEVLDEMVADGVGPKA